MYAYIFVDRTLWCYTPISDGFMLIVSYTFLSDPGIPGPIYGSSCLKLSMRPFADLTDVTLADEDTNSILADNAKRNSKR